MAFKDKEAAQIYFKERYKNLPQETKTKYHTTHQINRLQRKKEYTYKIFELFGNKFRLWL